MGSTEVPSRSIWPGSTLLSLDLTAVLASSAAQSASCLACLAFVSARAANTASCDGVASAMVGKGQDVLSLVLMQSNSEAMEVDLGRCNPFDASDSLGRYSLDLYGRRWTWFAGMAMEL